MSSNLSPIDRTPIVAYDERASENPETGEPGIIRKEWRVVPFDSYTYEKIVYLWGYSDRWSCVNPHFIMERRYIIRGDVGPWEPIDMYEDYQSAYAHLDIPHTCVIWEFIDIKKAADETMRRLREEKAVEEEKERQRVEKQRIRAACNEAFTRLMESSEEGKALCERWNAFVSSNDAKENKERYAADEEFMGLYRAAMDSHTIPSKRKTLRVFLEYIESRESRTSKPIEWVSDSAYRVVKQGDTQ